MRISQHSIWNIKKNILTDLYGVHLDKIEKEKEVFLRKNLALEYTPYTEYIAKIPEQLLNCGYKYSVRVIYKKDDPVNRYNQTWSISLKNKEHSPQENKTYIVYPSLYSEVAAIIEREQKIEKEKREMDIFITDTFDITTGSKQIKRMWPESLHKYLPTEPTPVKKQKSSKGKRVLPTITAPSQLNTRLVNNLLEK